MVGPGRGGLDVASVRLVDTAAEIARALAVVTPVGRWGRLDVHLVGDLLDAMTNIRGWNDDRTTASGQEA